MDNSIPDPAAGAQALGDYIVSRSNVQADVAPNPFKKLWDLGYRSIIPIVPPQAALSPTCQLAKKLEKGRDDRGKAPGEQRPDGLWTGLYGWQVRETTEADLERWWQMKAGVGLADDGGLVLLDIDAQDEATANAIEADAVRILGPAPCRVGSWPKRLLLYRVDETLSFTAVTFRGPGEKPDRVELLAKPKQAVVYGEHNRTGKPYKWVRPLVARSALTLVTKAQVDALFKLQQEKLPAAVAEKSASLTDRQAVDQTTLKGDVEHVRKAVRSIPNTEALFPSYGSMVTMGMAIHAACADDPEAAREIWHEWASRWEGGDYEQEVSDACWETFRAPHAVGAPWIYRQAEQHSDGRFTKADVHFDPTAAPPADPAPGPEGTSPAPKFQFLTLDEVADTALTISSRPLVEDLLDQGAMTVLYGESNTGKTFVTMDLAYHVAAGRPWGGMETRQHSVVYIVAEGGMGARKRAAAIRAKYGPCADFHYLLMPVNLRDPKADLGPLIEALRGVDRLGLVVLDTLSRVLAGGDENSSVDMGALVRHFDAIRAATGAHLIAVHHTGKKLANGARGHSLLRAATDTEIEISDRKIKVTKQRDMEKFSEAAFGLETVVLGQNARGRDVTSCTLRLIPRGGVEAGELTQREAEVLGAVDTALAATADPTKGAKLAGISSVLGETGAEGANRVRGHLCKLVEKNRLVKVGRGVWVPRDIHTASYFEAVEPPEETPKNLGKTRPTEALQNHQPQTTDFSPIAGVFS